MVRHFELRDLGVLHRYREQCLFLDSARALTWGTTLAPVRALVSSFAPAASVATLLCQDAENPDAPLLAQVVHPYDSPCAHLSFIAPDSGIESAALPGLLDALVFWAGERGAQSMVAEVEEGVQVFDALRDTGYSVYSRQRIWKLPAFSNGEQSAWHAIMPEDEINIRKLYNNLVPGLVQQVEPLPWGRLTGQVYYEEGELIAFAEIAQGPNGIWLHPFFHPDMEEVARRLSELVRAIMRLARPVYLVVRSYQTWLEYTLETLGAEPGPPQAVMVRRMAVTQSARQALRLPTLEGGTAKTTTTPIAQGSNGNALISYDEKTDH